MKKIMYVIVIFAAFLVVLNYAFEGSFAASLYHDVNGIRIFDSVSMKGFDVFVSIFTMIEGFNDVIIGVVEFAVSSVEALEDLYDGFMDLIDPLLDFLKGD